MVYTYADMDYKRTTVFWPEDKWEAYRRAALTRRVSLSRLVIEAMDAYLSEQPDRTTAPPAPYKP